MVHVLYNPMANNKKGKVNAEKIKEVFAEKIFDFVVIVDTLMDVFDTFFKKRFFLEFYFFDKNPQVFYFKLVIINARVIVRMKKSKINKTI